MPSVRVITEEDVARIEKVAAELFADCGPRLTGDDRGRLASVLRDVLKNAVVVDEKDVHVSSVESTEPEDIITPAEYVRHFSRHCGATQEDE